MTTKILLVDDSSICNLVMKKVLAQLPIDAEIHDFTDPVVALSQVPSLNPSLIFLDLNMPKLDGWEFLQTMKDTALTHRVIILTSSTSLLDRCRCAEFPNVLAYHNKPITKDTMTALLHLFQQESLG